MAGIKIGDTVGDYEVTGLLGRGGMGKVFRVRSLLTDREEAMKVIFPDLQDQTALAERFLREIKLHASLTHPNIAALHTALRVEDQIVMILELVQGVSLEDKIRGGPLPYATAIHYISQVLSALSFAHARAVIHRDIKPANILIATGDVVKLTDFGIARAAKDLKLTHTGFALGSLPYMSPEQIRNEPADPRSDVYSLGVTFYEAVTGKRPIHGDSEYALMSAQLSVIPPRPSEVTPSVPDPISDVIMKALEKDPGNRFQSAAEFQLALSAWHGIAAPLPVSAPSPPPGVSPEELARIESSLVRVLGPIARHVVKDAARRFSNLSDLCLSLASQISETREREAFLKSSLGTAATDSSKATRTTGPTGAPTWNPELLNRLEQALAAHIGPIAKLVVKRTAKVARTPDELYRLLSAEIASDNDRKRFLAAFGR